MVNPELAKHILECLEIHIENQQGMFDDITQK